MVSRAPTEREFIAGFGIPAHVLARPEHEIEHGREPPERCAIRSGGMNDFWPSADHELELGRKSPGLLEQDIDRHLGTRIIANGREANFQLEPVFDRRELERERRTRMKALGT